MVSSTNPLAIIFTFLFETRVTPTGAEGLFTFHMLVMMFCPRRDFLASYVMGLSLLTVSLIFVLRLLDLVICLMVMIVFLVTALCLATDKITNLYPHTHMMLCLCGALILFSSLRRGYSSWRYCTLYNGVAHYAHHVCLGMIKQVWLYEVNEMIQGIVLFAGDSRLRQELEEIVGLKGRLCSRIDCNHDRKG